MKMWERFAVGNIIMLFGWKGWMDGWMLPSRSNNHRRKFSPFKDKRLLYYVKTLAKYEVLSRREKELMSLSSCHPTVVTQRNFQPIFKLSYQMWFLSLGIHSNKSTIMTCWQKLSKNSFLCFKNIQRILTFLNAK